MGQAQYVSQNVELGVSVGAAMIANPDTRRNNSVSAETCSCENKVFTSRKSKVKTNNFQFGGRIDVNEAAQASETASNTYASAGYAQKQSTTVRNNYNNGTTSGGPPPSCITQCIN